VILVCSTLEIGVYNNRWK